MRTRRSWFTSTLTMVFLLPSADLRGDEETVPLDKVPRAVMEGVKARFADAKPTEAAKETEDGKTVYEVSFKQQGKNVDATLSPEGELLMIETAIDAKDLPKAATKTLEEKYPKATYKIVEKIVKVEKKRETLAYYEVLLATAEKDAIEVQVTAEGKVVNEEKKGPGEDDKKKDDE